MIVFYVLNWGEENINTVINLSINTGNTAQKQLSSYDILMLLCFFPMCYEINYKTHFTIKSLMIDFQRLSKNDTFD